MKLRLSVAIACVLASSCGDESSGGTSDGGGGGGGGGGPEPVTLLGSNPTVYVEQMEASNGSAQGAESTMYTLEADQGLRIEGGFEASSPTSDSYRFASGGFGAVGKPGFPGVDVQLVVDGEPIRDNAPLLLSLDTVAERGYSSLRAGGYFTNAALIRGDEYIITIAPTAPGARYALEIRAHR